MPNSNVNVIALEVTRLCNLNCPHCYTNAGSALPDELSTQEWYNTLDQIAAFGPGMLGWSGGEPLLRPDFMDIFCYAGERHGLRATLVSNGLTITPENLARLRRHGLINVQISLDGSSHDVNARIRGGTAEKFDRILESLRYCREAGVQTILGVMPHPENIGDIPNIINLARRFGVPYIRFCAFVPSGRGQQDPIRKRYQLDPGQYASFVEMTSGVTDPAIIVDPVAGPMPPDYVFSCRTGDGCPAGSALLYISADGGVYPCTALWAPEFKAGSIRERSLKDIYDDDRIRTVGRFSKGNIKGLCRACGNFDNCGGACRGTVYGITGDLSASLPYCYYRAQMQRLPG